jgi:hypothetical protein
VTKHVALLSLFPLLSFGTACTEFVPVEATDPTAELRLNEIQVIGSHNSYKTQPKEAQHPELRFMTLPRYAPVVLY